MKHVSRIPIQNLYYLLAYAWELFRGGEPKQIDSSQCPDSVNLLAHLLWHAVERTASLGLNKNYQLYEEVTPRLRGRLDLLTSYRKLTHLSGSLRCEFDELTTDTLLNQIILATCRSLLRSSDQLESANRAHIRRAVDWLRGVSEIDLERRAFRQVQWHRNVRHYRLAINICQLLYDCQLPGGGRGSIKFTDLLEDEIRMSKLFEHFVFGFARRHCAGASVTKSRIAWCGEYDAEVANILPQMETDVSIEYRDRTSIVECKFYRETMLKQFGAARVRSQHLYQLAAYLQNKSREDSWSTVRGVLLYAQSGESIDRRFELLGHPVEIQTLDLNRPWPEIHGCLFDVLSR